MKDELISIIVPVYRVEPYLEKCLESLRSQTYRNLEIILVDDGSPDNCGAICDRYAREDSRFRVFHTENGGLSAARNVGLRAASGDYIGFVDSDDWTEPEMYEKLHNAIIQTGADVSCCCFYTVFPQEVIEMKTLGLRLLDAEDALRELIEGACIRTGVWSKLYRRELWEDVSFPEGRIFEDVLTTYRIFRKMEKLAAIPEHLYYYRRREDSICGTYSVSVRVQMTRAYMERADDLLRSNPELSAALCRRMKNAIEGLKRKALRSPLAELRAEKDLFRQELAPFWQRWRGIMGKRLSLNRRTMLAFGLFFRCPELYWVLYRFKNRSFVK